MINCKYQKKEDDKLICTHTHQVPTNKIIEISECKKCDWRVIEEKKKSKKKPLTNHRYTSLYINEEDGIIAEQVYNDLSKFAVYDSKTDEVTYQDNIIEGDLTYHPLFGEEIEKRAILLSTEAEDYGTDEQLDEHIRQFINIWLDIPEDFLQFAIWNIKRSWIYEKFHTLNYLKALGDTGQGKSRFLDTLGLIHYKPIKTSGATTPAPIFRIIDKWRGTLIMDEADFQKSDEAQDIIKIINQGYEKGNHIMRCDTDDKNKIKFFDPYCPKILATRRSFYDKAVESRCITKVMTGTFNRNIPVNLNRYFFEAAQKIRNMLLMWRFRNYFKIDPVKEVEFDSEGLEPRVMQIVNSFISLFADDEIKLRDFKEFIHNYQDDIIDERRNSFEGAIVEAIYTLIESGEVYISSKDIVKVSELDIKPRSLSSKLKALGFKKNELKRVDGKVKRCIPIEENHIKNLFQRYGFKCNDVTIVTDYKVNTKKCNGVTVVTDYKVNTKKNKEVIEEDVL